MSSTPPPHSGRAHTPPTPLFGVKADKWEAHSPRRSTRITARDADSIQNMTLSKEKKATFRRTSSQTFSPPSSPMSPSRDVDASEPERKRAKRSPPHEESASLLAPTMPSAIFPTPAKTPRKRQAASNAAMKGTARVLFPGNTVHPEDEIPTPRKARKAQRVNAMTLDSFETAANADQGIEIYTDSKERIPEVDDSEDNPFSIKSTSAPKSKAQTRTRKSVKTGLGQEIDDAVNNDEGMVYVFRGKKIFKRFDSPSNAERTNDFADGEVRRAAGIDASRRITRSSLKPRLLFPPATPVDDSDEEAVTDIEQPETPSKSHRTPAKRASRLITPPTTLRKTRHAEASEITRDGSPLGPDSDSTGGSQSKGRPGKSPFDYWQRTKPGQAASKRVGDDLEPPSGKRTCSATSKPTA